MKNIVYLTLFFCICHFGNTLLAQAKNDPILRHTLMVSTKKHNTFNSDYFLKVDGEAAQFDVEKYILENIHHSNMHIMSDVTTYTKRVKLDFDSKKIEATSDCRKLCKKIVSTHKVPLLGLVTTPLDDLQGVLVETVVEGSGADLTGISQGDVITYIGDSIVQSGCDMNTVLADVNVGDVLEVHVNNENGQEILPVVLGYKILEKVTYEYCCPEEDNTVELDHNNQLTVFPNPTDGLGQFSFTSSQLDDLQIKFTDIAGHQIHQKEIKSFSGFHNESFDLTKYPAGIYFLQVVQGEEIWTEKIVLQNL